MKPPRRPPPARPRRPQAGEDRKRTMAITLLALGAGAVTIGAFTGLGSSSRDRLRVFGSVASCEADGQIPAAECAAQYQQALSAHERSAPAFATRENCENEYGAGNCVNPSAASGRPSMFIPMMNGYLMARRATGGFQAAPLYRRPADPAGEFRQSAAFPFPITQPSSTTSSRSSFRPGFSTSSPSATRSTTRSSSGITTSSSRGGFGASARSSSGT